MLVSQGLLYSYVLVFLFILFKVDSCRTEENLKGQTIKNEAIDDFSSSISNTYSRGFLLPYKPFKKPSKTPNKTNQGIIFNRPSILPHTNNIIKIPTNKPASDPTTSPFPPVLPTPSKSNNRPITTTEKILENVTVIENYTTNRLDEVTTISETTSLDPAITEKEYEATEINKIISDSNYESTENLKDSVEFPLESNDTTATTGSTIEITFGNKNASHNVVTELTNIVSCTGLEPNVTALSNEATEITSIPSGIYYETTEDSDESNESSPEHNDTVNENPIAATDDSWALQSGKNSSEQQQCKRGNGFYIIPGECDTYIECRKHEVSTHVCPDGLLFNPSIPWPNYPCAYASELQCNGMITQLKVTTKYCEHKYGIFASSRNCSQYIICKEGVAYFMNCPLGLAFNTRTSSCDWPENVPHCTPSALLGYPCSPENRNFKYRYQNSCRSFVMCQQSRPLLLKCDVGLSFDETLQMCIDSKNVFDCDEI